VVVEEVKEGEDRWNEALGGIVYAANLENLQVECIICKISCKEIPWDVNIE
jgi:hypothetical protein